MSRLLRISLAAIAVSAAFPVYAQTVTITTAGGDYGNAIKEAMWAPAAKELGYDVREETQSDGLAALKDYPSIVYGKLSFNDERRIADFQENKLVVKGGKFVLWQPGA